MNGAELLPWWAAIAAALMLVLGGLITVIGALGLLRLQDFFQRIHGPAITVTLGAGCILIASMISFTFTQSRPVIHEVLISIFVLMTAPVVSMLVMRAAVRRGPRTRDAIAEHNARQGARQDAERS